MGVEIKDSGVEITDSGRSGVRADCAAASLRLSSRISSSFSATAV